MTEPAKKLPYMKWYAADWRADPRLRICSLAARGLWKEMICLMHEAIPYGSLTVSGTAINDRQLASLAGATVREVSGCLAELESAGVFSRHEDGTIYSRRMVRDKAKAERDKLNGKEGGNPSLKGKANRGVNPQDKAQIPEARVQKERPDQEEESLKGTLAPVRVVGGGRS